jgi:TolA-binding protein
MASTFFATFIEVMVDLGIPRERAETLSEMLRSEIDAKCSLAAQVARAQGDVAKIQSQGLQARAEIEERISRIYERIDQRSQGRDGGDLAEGTSRPS